MKCALLAAVFGLAHGLPAASHESDEQQNLLRRVGRLLALGQNLPPIESYHAGFGCVSIAKSGDAVVSDKWCQTSCPTGVCPETLCKCEASASAAMAINFHASEASGKVCKSVTPNANDYWCNLHCAKRDCSAKMCECEEGPKEKPKLPVLTAKDGDCPGYTSVPDLHDDSMSSWCANSCPLFCPPDKCICTTDMPAPKRTDLGDAAPGAAAYKEATAKAGTLDSQDAAIALLREVLTLTLTPNPNPNPNPNQP